MSTTLKKNKGPAPARRAQSPTEIVTSLSKLDGWTLSGDGTDVVIEKSYTFADYFETIAFVNVVAFIAHRQDHHPTLTVHYNRCTVRYNTHDVRGLSSTDFDCAAQLDALLV